VSGLCSCQDVAHRELRERERNGTGGSRRLDLDDLRVNTAGHIGDPMDDQPTVLEVEDPVLPHSGGGVRQLNTEIRDWIDTWNENPRPYVWTKTAEQILDSIKRYCERINRTGH
jgi:hypothetical protein